MTARKTPLPSAFRWTRPGRAIIFVLAASSIASLLAEFYGLGSMRWFAISILIPAMGILIVLAGLDFAVGDQRLCRGVVIGAVAGFMAAIAYDLFRLPFVYAQPWHLTAIVPPMNLFKVFPRFGAMILGQPLNQAHYPATAQWVGWAYHFSNGISFGIMYVAMIGDGRRPGWGRAVAMAVGLELGMLMSPYPQFFGIPRTFSFVLVTLSAHCIFGVAMAVMVRSMSLKWEPSNRAL